MSKKLVVSEEFKLLRAITRYHKLLAALSKGQTVNAKDFVEAREAYFGHPITKNFVRRLFASSGDDNQQLEGGDNE